MSTTQLHNLPDSLSCPALAGALQAALQARRRYEEANALLTRAGLLVIAHAFRFTAAQEKEHAAVLRGLLLRAGMPLPPEEALPPLPGDPTTLLQTAAAQETACAQELFPACIREAEAAGLPRAAAALRRIAATEALHARRFRQYLDALCDGTLLDSPVGVSWVCLRCGCLHHGRSAPESCDGCSGGRGSFIRSDFHPFSVR